MQRTKIHQAKTATKKQKPSRKLSPLNTKKRTVTTIASLSLKCQKSTAPLMANTTIFTPTRSFTRTRPLFHTDACSTESDQRQSAMSTLLTNAFAPKHLDIKDVSGGCGAFYNITVVSDQFVGKMTLARHRAVQTVLKDIIPQMHGLTLLTYTPQQWDDMTAKQAAASV